MSNPILRPRLKASSAVPYGGAFKLNLPELGMVGIGTTADMLERNIREYRRANGIPCGLGLSEEIEREICRYFPQECQESDARMPNTAILLGWGDVAQGTRLLIKHKLAGSPVVDDPEATRRAQICLGCPWNLPVALPCGGLCGELKDAVDSVIGARATQYSDRLRSCGICKCWLSAAIFVPLEMQQSVLDDDQKEKFRAAGDLFKCWKAQNL